MSAAQHHYPPPGAIAVIQAAIVDEYRLPVSAMITKLRRRGYAWPRQEAMFLVREITDLSLPQIGRAFGNRDHTTVIHAIARTTERLRGDPELAERLDRIRVRVLRAS